MAVTNRTSDSTDSAATVEHERRTSATHTNGTSRPVRDGNDIPVPTLAPGLDRYLSHRAEAEDDLDDQEPIHDGKIGAKPPLFSHDSFTGDGDQKPERGGGVQDDMDGDKEGEDDNDHAGMEMSSHPETHIQLQRKERHGKSGRPVVVVTQARPGFGGVSYSGSSIENDGSSTSSRSSRSSDCQQVDGLGAAIKPTAGPATQRRKTASQARPQPKYQDEEDDEDTLEMPLPLTQSKTRGKAPPVAPSGTAGRRVSSRINDTHPEVGEFLNGLILKIGTAFFTASLKAYLRFAGPPHAGDTFDSPFKLVQAAAALVMQGNQHLAYVSLVGGKEEITVRCNNSRPKVTREEDPADPEKGQPFTCVTDCTFHIRAIVPKENNKKRLWLVAALRIRPKR